MNVIFTDAMDIFNDLVVFNHLTRRVGIGTLNPLTDVHIVKDNSIYSGTILCDAYNNLNTGYDHTFRYAHGTAAAPTPLVSGDKIGRLGFDGWTPSGFRGVAALRVDVDGSPDGVFIPGSFNFFLGTSTSPLSLKMKLSNTGVLRLEGNTGAIMPPRLTTADRDVIGAENGMIVYNTTDNKFQGYENGAWVNLV